MKKLAQLGLLLALVLGAFESAHADLLIEPLVGVNLGNKFNIKTQDDYSGGGGAGYGGRLGYQNFGLQLGVDYLKSSIDMGDDDFDKNVSMNEWAGFVGFKFPVLFRVYAGYIFSALGDSKYKSQDFKLESGTGTKFGVGFTGLPFVNINLEYRSGSFDSYKLDGVKTNEKTDYSAVFLGLSIPFTI